MGRGMMAFRYLPREPIVPALCTEDKLQATENFGSQSRHVIKVLIKNVLTYHQKSPSLRDTTPEGRLQRQDLPSAAAQVLLNAF